MLMALVEMKITLLRRTPLCDGCVFLIFLEAGHIFMDSIGKALHGERARQGPDGCPVGGVQCSGGGRGEQCSLIAIFKAADLMCTSNTQILGLSSRVLLFMLTFGTIHRIPSLGFVNPTERK